MVSPMPPTVIRQSRGKLLFGLLGCVAFVAIGVAMYNANTPHGLRWVLGVYLGIPVFGFFGLMYLWSLINPATITLSPQGFEAKQLFGTMRYAWPQIAGVDVQGAGLVSPVMIRLADGKTKTLTPMWEKKPAEIAQMIGEAQARWTPQPAPAPTPPATNTIVG